MEIPPRQYERPTIRQVLTYASGEFSEDKATAFAREHGYLRRLPVVKQSRTFSLSSLQPGGLPDEIPGRPWSEPVLEWNGERETVALWRKEWKAMNAFAGLYGAIMQHPSERIVPSVGVDIPEGEYRGDAVLSFDEVEPLLVVDEQHESAGLRKSAARIVAKKLDENQPATGYTIVDGTLMKWSAGTLLHHVWTTFLHLASGKSEAKRWLVWQKWEVKGEGYA